MQRITPFLWFNNMLQMTKIDIALLQQAGKPPCSVSF
jgi:hypothetical protein